MSATDEADRGADGGTSSEGLAGGKAVPALTHVDATGAARMVDVSHKRDTVREARAGGVIRMLPSTLAAIRAQALSKGDVIAVARTAGFLAAKRTPELIPLCHPIPLSGMEIEIVPDETLPGLRVEATVRCTGKTGAEMEALTAVSLCLLTIYDMAKGVDPAMEVGYIAVLSKTGGKSGSWQRAES